MDKLTAVTVALAGIELRSNAMTPRRKVGTAVLPTKK